MTVRVLHLIMAFVACPLVSNVNDGYGRQHESLIMSRDAGEPTPIERGRSRPLLHSFRRALHPSAWISAGVRSLLRAAEGGFLQRSSGDTASTVKAGGVRFEVGEMGEGSGIGPKIVPFHNDLFGRHVRIEVPLVVTYRLYQAYGINLTVPLKSEGAIERLDVELDGGYSSRPSDRFNGIGNATPRGNKSEFRSVSRELGAAINAQLSRSIKASILLRHRNIGITAPRGDTSAQDRFSEFEVPALTTGAEVFSSGLRFDWDTKDREHYATAGGLRRLDVSLNTGTAADPFHYWKYRLELQQFFKLGNDPRKVVALRAAVESNQEKPGHRIPFFNLPRIGSWDTVRGLDTFRYYDKSAAYYGVEYRFGIWHILDSALFVDQGQVAAEPGDFSFKRFHTGYGARLIALPKPGRPLSVEFGRSGNTWRFYVSANRKF